LYSVRGVVHILYNKIALQEMFGFELPSVRIARRTVKFISKFNERNCVFS